VEHLIFAHLLLIALQNGKIMDMTRTLSNFLLCGTLILGFSVVFPVSAINSTEDADGDGLSNKQEIGIYYTDPNNPDTDGDTFPDFAEINQGFSPLFKNKLYREADFDKDGVMDDWELYLGTNPKKIDTDNDGYSDLQEIMSGYDPTAPVGQKMGKKIEINLKNQSLTYYFGNKKLDEFKISSGLKGMDTPTGEFAVIQKKPTVWYKGPGYNYPNTKWNLMFKRGSAGLNYYVHGAYWHNDFGKQRSHGCVNVPYKYDYMGRLYDFAEVGTKISIK
jgi:lipoprotein-anchoring transpeptidase ErfK/SrfK